jgi:hypothetical protein
VAVGFLYNGFGKYDQKDGVKGINLFYAGIPWFLPYQQVTAIPNWTLREIDHDRSTPPLGEVGELVYQSVVIPGVRICEELVDKQVPVPFAKMGVIRIEGKSTGREITIPCGSDADGRKLDTQIIEREATSREIKEAEALAEQYKKDVLADYFQSKRERMNGGRGKNVPSARERLYMDEIGVEDNDDVTAHAKHAGVNPDLLKGILTEVMSAMNRMNQETVAEAVVTAIKKTSTSEGPKGGIIQNARKGLRNVIDHEKLEAEKRAAEEQSS